MGKMKANVFVEKAVEIAKNFKTLYVMGCFGAPLTGSNVSRYCNNHSYNRAADRTAMIKAAGNQNPPVYGFDCVCLIKGILWGRSQLCQQRGPGHRGGHHDHQVPGRFRNRMGQHGRG